MGAETPTHDHETVDAPQDSPAESTVDTSRVEAERTEYAEHHARTEAQHEQDAEVADAHLTRGLQNLDDSTAGRAFETLTGQTLSEGKKTTGNAFTAHTFESAQQLWNVVTNPIETGKNILTAIQHPVDSYHAVKDAYAGEWDAAPNAYTKTAVAFRGALDFVFGPKGAGAVARGAGRAARAEINAASRAEQITQASTTLPTVEQAGQAGEVAEAMNAARRIETRGGAELNHEQVPILTREEKLAARPRYIEAERWEELIDLYAKRADKTPMSIAEIESAHHVEMYLEKIGVPSYVWNETVKSFDLTDQLFMGELTQDTQVHRYFGGESRPRGYYVTDQYLPTVKERVDRLALPMKTQINAAVYHETFIIPAGTPVIRGRAAANFGKVGGEVQYFVDKEALQNIRRVGIDK